MKIICQFPSFCGTTIANIRNAKRLRDDCKKYPEHDDGKTLLSTTYINVTGAHTPQMKARVRARTKMKSWIDVLQL